MKAARRIGLAVALVLLGVALVAEQNGQLQLRLLMWIAAGVTGGPSLLHGLVYGLRAPTAQQPRSTTRTARAIPAAPARVYAVVTTAQWPALTASASARRGRPPSPRPVGSALPR